MSTFDERKAGKMKKFRLKQERGITLIALIITIIILVILAAVSIRAVANMGIVGHAINGTQQYARAGADENQILDKTGRRIEDAVSRIKEIQGGNGSTGTGENSGNNSSESEQDLEENSEVPISSTARPGIKIGDYVRYESPKYKDANSSVYFTYDETGYHSSSPVEVSPVRSFQVLDIHEDGSLELISQTTLSDIKDGPINFEGAQGYNNLINVLNMKASELYSNLELGITARTWNLKDITDRLTDTGKAKISNYLNAQVAKLEIGEDVIKGTKEDGVTLDNTVTYSNSNRYYPDIFQYGKGGMIDGTETSGKVNSDEVYDEYGNDSILTSSDSGKSQSYLANESITVPYTCWPNVDFAFDESDFKSVDSPEYGTFNAYLYMFFNNPGTYLTADRLSECYNDSARFTVGIVGNFSRQVNYGLLFTSNGNGYATGGRLRCILSVPADVEITVGERDEYGYASHTIVTN